MSQQESEPFLAFYSLLAKLIVWAEASGVGVEGIGSVVEYYFEGIDAFAVVIEVVSQVHVLVEYIINNK